MANKNDAKEMMEYARLSEGFESQGEAEVESEKFLALVEKLRVTYHIPDIVVAVSIPFKKDDGKTETLVRVVNQGNLAVTRRLAAFAWETYVAPLIGEAEVLKAIGRGEIIKKMPTVPPPHE